MQELKLLMEVIQTFENKANEMIKVLALEFNLNLNSEKHLNELVEELLKKGILINFLLKQ